MTARNEIARRALLMGASALAAAAARPPAARADDDADDPWPSLASQIFNDRPVLPDGGAVAIEAPYRADDAAIVPVTLRILPGAAVRKVTLVIDHNPSPVAAVFTLGGDGGITALSTAVRVNAYTNLHAVAELADGALHASSRFIKASGGCSAPGMGVASGGVPRGTMRFRQFPPAQPGAEPEAQIVIRHPNFSGMQMDQLTHLYIPALFVHELHIWQGDAELLAVDGGISIAEDPRFRFTYRPNGARSFRARMTDSEGKAFEATWPAAAA